MISRASHFYRTMNRIRIETGSNRRAVTYAARLLGSNLKRFRRQSWAAAIAPRRAKDVAALAEAIGGGNPSIGVRASGGVGDYVVIARYLRDMFASTPEVAFDIYCSNPHVADWVFCHVPGYRRAYHDILFESYFGFYDLAMRISQFVLVQAETINWPKLYYHPVLTSSIDHLVRSRPGLELVIQRHPYMDNFLASIAIFKNRTRRDFLHGMAKLSYGGDGMKLPLDHTAAHAHGLFGSRYIVVQNGFDANFVITSNSATKCYPHFAPVLAGLRRLVPGLRFVQVGSSTSQPIEGVDIDLIGKTTLAQAAGLLHGAELLLDNEGGLVHVAACLGVRSCVIFGPTPSRFFAYPDNINIDPVFCGGCWWMTETWMDICPRGFASALCMHDQPPQSVVDRIAPVLAENARATAA